MGSKFFGSSCLYLFDMFTFHLHQCFVIIKTWVHCQGLSIANSYLKPKYQVLEQVSRQADI